MKKIILICVALLSAATMSAKGNKTQTSVGIVGGLGIGAQAKFMFTEHFGMIEELGYFFNPDGGTAEKYGRSSYAGLMNNIVLLGQSQFKETDGMALSWYAGGQFKLGWMPFNFQRNVHMGVFGIGVVGGVEAKMKKAPIAVSFDVRPGYALMFADYKGSRLFDYSFNLGVRYCFKNKK